MIPTLEKLNPSIKEQVLILSDTEKIKWQNALQKNLEGNNRYYLYNFITDNCTTRVKDGYYQFATTQVPPSNINSFRTHLVEAPYHQGIPWIGLGIGKRRFWNGLSDHAVPLPAMGAADQCLCWCLLVWSFVLCGYHELTRHGYAMDGLYGRRIWVE